MDDVLRRHFEAQFGKKWSTEVNSRSTKARQIETRKFDRKDAASAGGAQSGESDEGEFNGFSDSDAEAPVSRPVVVRHSEVTTYQPQRSKRKFLSSTAPRKLDTAQVQAGKDESDSDEYNAKSDLELQRLISESHILAAAEGQYSGADISGGNSLESIGKHRLRIMDQRLLNAGAKRKAEKRAMPLAIRRKQKQEQMEAERRADAEEAGIVLERQKKKRRKLRSTNGLQIHGVGRVSRGQIELSARDIGHIMGKPQR